MVSLGHEPGRQVGRHSQIHWAIAAPHHYKYIYSART